MPMRCASSRRAEETMPEGSWLEPRATRARVGRAVRAVDHRLFPSQSQYARLLRTVVTPDFASVLDVGCGDDARLLELVPDLPYAVGVDAKIPERRSGPGRHAEYRELDIRELAANVPPRTFECVVA